MAATREKKISIAIGFLVIIVFIIFMLLPDEHNAFVEKLTAAVEESTSKGPVLLSNVMPGDWSFVCILGESATPSYYVNKHLGYLDNSDIKVLPNDLMIGDGGWALAFYFPKRNEVIVQKGYTGLLNPYRLADDQPGCVDNKESAYIVKSDNGYLKILNR